MASPTAAGKYEDEDEAVTGTRVSQFDDNLTPLEREMKLKWLNRLSYAVVASPLVYAPIHYSRTSDLLCGCVSGLSLMRVGCL